MELITYEHDLEIDQDSLDREFIMQPRLYMKYAELSARADNEAKNAKEAMELERARTYTQIIRSSDKKPTEEAIKAQISLDADYRKAVEYYQEKQYESNVLASAVKAFEHKKSSLENLTKLWVGGYFSTPRQTTDSEKVKNENRASRQRRRLNKGEE